MRKVSACLFIAALAAVLILLFMTAVVNPAVAGYAQIELDALTVKAVNSGITAAVSTNTYSELTDIRRNEKGVIVSISADFVKMNRIAGDIAEKAQKALDAMAEGGIPVPIGTFSGIPLLVGKGPAVKLNIRPVGSVNCRFDSVFAAAGINQTHHKISLFVDTVVQLVLPLSVKRTEVSVQMLFSESIIVGEVPEFLFNTASR
jgi:sporulation protein YunB